MGTSRLLFHLLSLATTSIAITSEEASLTAWKAYGQLIQQYMTANQPLNPGSDYIFVNPPTGAFVRGGTPVPSSITNFELFNAVDPLQSSTNPLLGTDGPSYTQSLETYLQSVAVADKVLTPEEKKKLATLEQAVTEAKLKFAKEKTTAFLSWRQDEVAQYFNQSFQGWVTDNDPQYANFQAQLVTADATYNNYMLSLYGSKYNLIQEQRNNINGKAQNELASVPGYNMMVYPGAPNYAISIKPFVKRELEDSVLYKPSYSLASYEDICDAYITGNPGYTTITYSLKNVDGKDWSSLGYQQKVTKYRGGFWSILGYKQTAESEVTNFDSWAGTWSQDVKVTVSMKGAPTVVSINPGFWEVGNVRKTYPKLRDSEKDNLAGYVRLTHALVAYQISMQIQFTNTESWRNVSQFIEKGKKNKGGSLQIFGFSFGAGGGGAYQYSLNDLKTSSTTDGGVINIPSTPEGMMFLLGARGKAL